MALQNLTFSNITKIPNGEDAVTEFDRLIRVAAEDCARRKEIGRPRKVVLQLTLGPAGNEIAVRVATKHILPHRESSLATGKLAHGGKLMVNPASTEDPDQGTLDT